MSYKDFWVSILTRLMPTIRKANFITWFQNTAVLKIENGEAVVGVPNVFAHTSLKGKYDVKILQAAQELDSTVTKISYVVDGNLGQAGDIRAIDVRNLFSAELEKKVRKVREENEVTITKGTSKIQSRIFNNRYRLDNFVVGSDNRLPHAACTAVANKPGGIYNPLYIYGKSGLGKTHLLQAIGSEILKDYGDKVVMYVTAEKFVTEVIDAIAKRRMSEFRNKYRHVDCLLMDDVQFFARKESSQQEFFHTFNDLYENNKQIVITSDRPPSELDGLDDRIKSRFSMGMVVELVIPDFETKVAILQQKCQEYQVVIEPEIINFIAMNVHSSVRELEGVLKHAIGTGQLSNMTPTISSVAEIIKRLNKAQEIIGYDIDVKRAYAQARTETDVMNIVADYYRVEVSALSGKTRKKEVNEPRQICMYLIKKILGSSYERIGNGFGRNHTTVMHACSKTESRLKKDLRLVRDINAIRKEMGL